MFQLHPLGASVSIVSSGSTATTGSDAGSVSTGSSGTNGLGGGSVSIGSTGSSLEVQSALNPLEERAPTKVNTGRLVLSFLSNVFI